jgi:uncharacterized protein
MILKTFQTAAEFLQEAQPALEANEAANGLMYGLALRLQLYPERIETPPYLAVVRSAGELQAAALMTPPHNLVVLSIQAETAPEAFDLVARHLAQEHWPVPGVVGPNEPALAFARVWQALTAEPYRLTTHERLYQLDQVIFPPQPAGCMRLAHSADVDLAARWVYDFAVEAVPLEAGSLEEALISTRTKIADQDFYLWEDGAPVALAGRSRSTPHSACIGPVYTPPELRGKGYATALTAALSQRLLDAGKQFTVLFTDLANPISNGIYQKIGYRPVCDFDLYRFEK